MTAKLDEPQVNKEYRTQKAQKAQNFSLLCNAKAGIFTQLMRVESTERNVESLTFNV